MNLSIPRILSCWGNELNMKAHYNAICAFRKVFETVHTEVHTKIREDKSNNRDGRCYNGFEDCPEPNAYWNVSLEGIFLKVVLSNGTISKLHTIKTPFGEMHVLGGGCVRTINKVSQETFEALHEICDLIDVSDIVRLHNLNLDDKIDEQKIYHDYAFGKKDKYQIEIENKLYLLHFKDNTYGEIVNIPLSDLHIFEQVINSDSVYRGKKELLKKFSDENTL